MIGKILAGRYEIINKLGQGAFGTTYLAIDRKLPDKDKCVVKHFSPQAKDPYNLSHARRLFETEAKVLNRLGNHEQIPRLLAHFEEDTQFYLVQEYVAGHDLSSEITYNKLWNEQDVIALLQVILEALQFVHQNDVIHRDIKPSNLIRREQDGQIFLVDFGAVKQISSHTVAPGDGGLTVAIGTRGYMPSEQSQGLPKFSSDIYAVGIIGIQALTGLPANQLAKDSLTSEITWNEQTQVNPKLGEILTKMVKYDFRQRYQSATEVLSALQSLKSHNNSPLKSMKWKIVIALGVATVVTFVTSWLFLIPRNNLEIYQSLVHGISIKYPQKWQKSVTPDRITGNMARFMPPSAGNADTSQENINLIVRDLPNHLRELQLFTNYYLDDIQQLYRDVKIIQQGRTQLSNQPAYRVIYTAIINGNTIQRLQTWTVKNKKAYIVTYTADIDKYSQYAEVAQKITNSLEIK